MANVEIQPLIPKTAVEKQGDKPINNVLTDMMKLSPSDVAKTMRHAENSSGTDSQCKLPNFSLEGGHHAYGLKGPEGNSGRSIKSASNSARDAAQVPAAKPEFEKRQ